MTVIWTISVSRRYGRIKVASRPGYNKFVTITVLKAIGRRQDLDDIEAIGMLIHPVSVRPSRQAGRSRRSLREVRPLRIISNTFRRASPYHHLVAGDIRLCTVLSSSEGGEIRCSLRVARLLDVKDNYRCLSYAWESTARDKTIVLNGISRPVTHSLWSALRSLIAHNLGNDIWIDAICVDQGNTVEKSQQVRFMSQIYSAACEVIVYLGEDETITYGGGGRVSGAVTVIATLAADVHLHAIPALYSDRYVADIAQIVASQSTLGLLTSPWWQRSWCVQEICFSRHTSVLYGSSILTWGLLSEALSNWHKHKQACCDDVVASMRPAVISAFHSTYRHITKIAWTKSDLLTGQSLLQVLLDYQHLKATDPRDKVFAFAGLAVGSQLTRPDYKMSTVDVFTHSTLALIEDQQTLLPLELDLRSHGDEAFPSWVVAWSSQQSVPHDYQAIRLLFLLSFNVLTRCKPNVEHLIPGKLKVYGTMLGKVDAVSECCKLQGNLSGHLELLRQWRSFAGAPSSSIADTFARDEFSRMVLSNRIYIDNSCRELSNTDLKEWSSLLAHVASNPNAGLSRLALHPLMLSHTATVLERRMFRTIDGRVGLCPVTTRPGDSLFVLAGAHGLSMLRLKDRTCCVADEYVLVGTCYVPGLMCGDDTAGDRAFQQLVLC